VFKSVDDDVSDLSGWQVDCNYVVSSSHGVFARLEHHKSHEYSSRRTAGGCSAGASRKCRGRPPKYATDYEFSEEEIRVRAAIDGPSSAIAHGFVRYTGTDQCPERRCAHRYREHFHCVRARCHNVELLPAALVAHDRDFHAHFRIAPGFEFFGADVDCRRPKCSARRGTTGPTGLRHFHCVRSGCDYAFVRQSTMAQHEAKHRMSDEQTLMTATIMSQQPSMSNTTSSSRHPVRIVPRQTATVSPLSPPSYSPVGMSTVLGKALLPGTCSTTSSLPTQFVSTTFPRVPSVLIASLPTTPITVAAGAVSVTSVSQATVGVTMPGAAVKGLVSSALLPSSIVGVSTEAKSGAQPAVVSPPARNHHGTGVDCGRQSCQLKQCDHFHCVLCDVAIADVPRLREHLSRVHRLVAAASVPAVHTTISRETTPLTNSNNSLPSTTASDTAARQLAPVCPQLASISAENAGLQDSLNNNAERHDNDNDNGGVLVIDLSSPGKGRSSNVEGGNAGDEADALRSSLKMTNVGGVQGDGFAGK